MHWRISLYMYLFTYLIWSVKSLHILHLNRFWKSLTKAFALVGGAINEHLGWDDIAEGQKHLQHLRVGELLRQMINKDIAAFWAWRAKEEMKYIRPHCYTWLRNVFNNSLGNNQNRMSVVIVASWTGNDIITFSLLQLLRLLWLLGNQSVLMWKWLTDQSISSRICSCGWSNEVKHEIRIK